MINIYLPLITNVFIIVSTYFIIGRFPITIQIILCIIISFLMLVVTPNRLKILFLLCISIPGIAELGSGTISGINNITIVSVILGTTILLNITTEFNKKNIRFFLPIFIFSLYHLISFYYGLAVSAYSPTSTFIISNIRDIIIYSLFSLYIIFNPLKINEKYEVTNIFIFVCVFAASLEVFESIKSALFIQASNWAELKTLNILDRSFGIEPVFYLIPLNLLLSQLILLEINKYRKIQVIGIFIIFLAIIASLQRTLMVISSINIFLVLFIYYRKNLKNSIIIYSSIILLTVLVVKILPIIEVINYTLSTNTASDIYGINIDTSGRWDKQWPFAIATWKTAPLFGIGHSQINVRLFFNRFDNYSFTEGVPLATNTHNVYLEYLAQGGIIGLIFVLWFCYIIMKTLINNRLILDRQVSVINSGLLFFWLVFLLTNIMNSYFWTSGTFIPFTLLYSLWGYRK